MAINVSQAFRRTSANPVDESMTLTKAQMLTVNDNLMPAYYFTICQDDGEIYLYNKSATVSAETGKFKKFEGGGSSSEGVVITKTLLASGWDANNRQTLTFTGYESNMGGVIGMPTNATAAQKEVYAESGINVYSQDGNQFMFSCKEKPSVDLPVTLYAGGGSGSGGGGTADFPAGGTTGQALVKKSNADNDVEWKDISGEGHTIQDNSGTDLPQRKNLKIVGASVADDSENNSTIITIDLESKVDKVIGKGLSTNDYTTEEKNKLAGLSNYDDTALSGRVGDIEDVIPDNASSSNKLVTQLDVSGASGHIIEDSTGIDMTSRNNLQFVGATVTDDSENDRTIVTINDPSGKEDKFRYTTMPEASAEVAAFGIVQYIGATLTNSFRHGMFYECKAQGTNPETYAWQEVSNIKELTQAEYDALSTNDRNNGTVYLISDKRTILCKSVNYSAERQIIDVEEPEVTIDIYTYNGTAQGPTIVSRDMEHTTVTNATATDAGTYTMTIALNNTATMLWEDGTTLDRHYEYTIEKASQSFSIDKNYMEFSGDTISDTATVSNIVGDGNIIVESNDSTIATVSVSENIITVRRGIAGATTISVKMSETTNYNQSAEINITAKVMDTTIVSWADGTDEEIVNLIRAADKGKLDLYEDAGWRVGDERVVHLSTMAADGVPDSHVAQDVTLVLLHKGFYKKTSDDSEVNFVVGVKDCLKEQGPMNLEDTNAGSWKECLRRTWCNNVFYNAIPSTLRPIFKQVKVITASASNITDETGLEQTDDYVFLAAPAEIFRGQGSNDYKGNGPSGDSNNAYANHTEFMSSLLTRFDYYAVMAHRIKLMNDSAYNWFCRSPHGDRNNPTDTEFCSCGYTGYASSLRANVKYGSWVTIGGCGLAPVMCI